jgi:molecular chaperone Hsp33
VSTVDGEGDMPVACRFVRGRNVLLCAADFGPVFMDLYLQLGQNGVVLAGGADERIKLLLGALTLHAAARPHAETCAWTVHLGEERLNLFAVAENPTGRVTGQLFFDHVKEIGRNVLHAETSGDGGSRRRSSVDFSGANLLRAAEEFYAQSEQRPARFFSLGGDRFAILVAQPDADLAWLEGVEVAEVLALADDETRPPLETRIYRFACGCTPERIAAAIGAAVRTDLDGVFGGEEVIRVSCPRCGAKHEIVRGLFDGPG